MDNEVKGDVKVFCLQGGLAESLKKTIESPDREIVLKRIAGNWLPMVKKKSLVANFSGKRFEFFMSLFEVFFMFFCAEVC